MKAQDRVLQSLGTGRILGEVREGIGWITFNHPERRNAMSLDMWQGLGAVAEAFERDPGVRVVVMKGAGGKAFVSGADISEFEQHRADAAQKKSYDEVAARGHAGLAALSKPLVAMIQGYCVGGGLAIALAADIRIAASSSRFAIPAARLGLGYDYRGVAALARLVGPSAAKDILFSARFLEAPEALRLGLVNTVVEDVALDEAVSAYAQRIAANAPLTVHAAKKAIQAFERYSDSAAADEIAPLVLQCFDSEDYREGRRAFLAKRPPIFQGR
ncbi:enoyl-CoA hydratase [Variovorax sp. Varisp41]|jgi:enoyl-CoA hydratase|uniref:enoyl-CoA hydratase n=1 Tax=unclassified Variovorax TaxID=663243 RepID=UPI000C5C89DA|nr:enoyl-CoA hydratase [Variovorax sp.]MBS79780.1 enoyl-CoA hydratase [Variovorax sp.]